MSVQGAGDSGVKIAAGERVVYKNGLEGQRDRDLGSPIYKGQQKNYRGDQRPEGDKDGDLKKERSPRKYYRG